ncbi:MAG: hypothetical protein D5S00_04005 [Tindallia sp. MSAO_Bac2]|nr:MAG: hypothetical protein D5S00_04005 [Tindallia sp. MSAO_Bac2]
MNKTLNTGSDDFYTYTLDSSISGSMVKKFFLRQDPHGCNGSYRVNNCRITVEIKHNRDYGVISIPCTEIIFKGKKEDCKAVIDAFRFHFLSAGG